MRRLLKRLNPSFFRQMPQVASTRDQLLRIPGIGLVGADAILKARRLGRLTELSHLRKLHISAPERAAPYILLDGQRPIMQMNLFE